MSVDSAAKRRDRPAALRGFEHVQRNWDSTVDRWSAKILPGEFFVTREDEVVTTVLGSCIAACIRDKALGWGGMNHFMLPEDKSVGSNSWVNGANSLSTRYGSFAMESLINEIIKLGAKRERLEVKIFGGGQILPRMSDVGAKNIAFARAFLTTEGLAIAGEDVGAAYPRRVIYSPRTGRVLLKRLPALAVGAVATREAVYQNTIASPGTVDNDVELFD